MSPLLLVFQAASPSGVLLRGAVVALSALLRVSPERAGRLGRGCGRRAAGRAAAERAAARGCWRSACVPAAEQAQGTTGSSAQRRSCGAQRRATAGQHRGGRRTAPGSAANATHLDRRGLSPSLAPAPRRERAATASIAGRRPAHSSNVHCDGACRVYILAGVTGPFLFSRVTPVQSAV